MTGRGGVFSSAPGIQNIGLGRSGAGGGGARNKCSCGGKEPAVTEAINMPWTPAVTLADALPRQVQILN